MVECVVEECELQGCGCRPVKQLGRPGRVLQRNDGRGAEWREGRRPGVWMCVSMGGSLARCRQIATGLNRPRKKKANAAETRV